MKRFILTAIFGSLLATASSLALADQQAPLTQTLTCGFTEPFFTLHVDLQKKTVSKEEPNWDGEGTVTTVIANDISLLINLMDPLLPKYTIVDGFGVNVLELTLNMKGSDGMSDITYPFSAKHSTYWGGCESENIKRVGPENP